LNKTYEFTGDKTRILNIKVKKIVYVLEENTIFISEGTPLLKGIWGQSEVAS
jgi:hypothetical protein